MTLDELRLSLRSYRFAAHDMLLYLDTHPCDEKAFSLYKALIEKSRALTDKYQCEYGPINASAAADYDEFNWICGPWPWEKGGNEDV